MFRMDVLDGESLSKWSIRIQELEIIIRALDGLIPIPSPKRPKPSTQGQTHSAFPASSRLMAKKSKAPAAVATAEAAADEMGVSSPQGPAHGSEGAGEKEGAFLLGQPTWEDAGGGRWRCAETGHELPEREKEAYGRSRACRLALIDHAVARKKPPLNAFKPHPEHKFVLPLRFFLLPFCSVLYRCLLDVARVNCSRAFTLIRAREFPWVPISASTSRRV